MANDDDELAKAIAEQQQKIYDATIESAPDVVRETLAALNQEVLYFFRTRMTGGFSGKLSESGGTTVTHVGSPISYLFHSQSWRTSHEITSIDAKPTTYKRVIGRREWWPVFERDLTPIEGKARRQRGVGSDITEETRKKRQLLASQAATAENPAEAVERWKRSEASAKGWTTRRATKESKAQKKREELAKFKYKNLKKTNPEKAAEFLRRSKAAKKAAKNRKKK